MILLKIIFKLKNNLNFNKNIYSKITQKTILIIIKGQIYQITKNAVNHKIVDRLMHTINLFQNIKIKKTLLNYL